MSSSGRGDDPASKPDEDAGDLRRTIETVLPGDLPRREHVVNLTARHGDRLLEVNRVMNLTSITATREVAIKHVLDSLAPWRVFDGSRSLLEIGTGGGYPGIPLAVVYPEKLFILSESTRKKAAFVAEVARSLDLENVAVVADRAESVLAEEHVDTVFGRAVGSVAKVLRLLSPVHDRFERLLLYKGPNARAELEEASVKAFRDGFAGRVALEYELPQSLGRRAMLEYTRRD